MKEFLKQNVALVLAFALPIVLIIGVALYTYLPTAFFTTEYNFIYGTCIDNGSYYYYNCTNSLQDRFSIEDDKLLIKPIESTQTTLGDEEPKSEKDVPPVHIFLHDTGKNESREITLEEAGSMTLSGLVTSPDGTNVTNSYDYGSGDFFLFGGSSSSGYYLSKGKSKSKLNLIYQDRYSYDNFYFIGWVLPTN